MEILNELVVLALALGAYVIVAVNTLKDKFNVLVNPKLSNIEKIIVLVLFAFTIAISMLLVFWLAGTNLLDIELIKNGSTIDLIVIGIFVGIGASGGFDTFKPLVKKVIDKEEEDEIDNEVVMISAETDEELSNNEGVD